MCFRVYHQERPQVGWRQSLHWVWGGREGLCRRGTVQWPSWFTQTLLKTQPCTLYDIEIYNCQNVHISQHALTWPLNCLADPPRRPEGLSGAIAKQTAGPNQEEVWVAWAPQTHQLRLPWPFKEQSVSYQYATWRQTSLKCRTHLGDSCNCWRLPSLFYCLAINITDLNILFTALIHWNNLLAS